MRNEEIYNENDLLIINTSWDWGSFLIKTPTYSVVACEILDYPSHWFVTIFDRNTPQKLLLRLDSFKMPEFMKPFIGYNCKVLKSAKEVDDLINRMLNIKIFL